MPTSAEIAQQISDQQSWFMQQNAMASQIGMSPMGYGGGAPVMPGHPAMAPMPGAFSYGMPNQMSWGNRAGAAVAAGLSATPFIGSALGGASPMFNPISGFMAARGAGLGIGASMGAAGAMMAPMALAAYGLNLGVQGIQQQAGVQHAVSNYSFANPAAMSGQGFSRQDAMAIGRQVRQLSNVPELMTSFEEITRILPQLKTMGMMQGVRDAAEFGKRMKEAIVTVREVSKILGTTMEEATQFFANSRGVGFFGQRDAVQNAMNARVTQAITGMNSSQFNQMQQQGAALGTALGGSRRLGAEGVTNIANQIGMAAMNNASLQETIANITGKTGAEGIQEAAGMFANIGVRLAGTNPGRFLMAGMMKVDERGQVVLDKDLMDLQKRGGLSMDDVRQRGMRNMGNRDFVKMFERNQTKLSQQFAGQGGPAAIAQLLHGAFGGDENSAALVMQRQLGMTEEQTDLTLELMREEGTGVGQQKRMVQEMVQRNINRRQRSPGSMMQRMGQRLANITTEPLRQGGADLANRVGSFFDEIKQDLSNDLVLQLSEDMQKELVDSIISQDTKSRVKKSFMDGAEAVRRARGGDRGAPKGAIEGAFSPFSAVSSLTSAIIGIDHQNSLTSQLSQAMGYSGSGSVSSLVSEAWQGSDLFAFANRGANDTGRTARGALRKYGEMFGLGTGASQSGLLSRLQQMTSSETAWTGGSEKGGKPSAAMSAAAAEAADIIEELAQTDEYGNANEQKRFEMARDAINKKYSRTMIAGKSELQGRDTDAATALWAGAQVELKKRKSLAVADVTGIADVASGMDSTALAQGLRKAEYDLGDYFGQDGGAGLAKSAAARDVLTQLYSSGDEDKKKRIREAIQLGGKASKEELEKITGQKLSDSDMSTIKTAFQRGNEGIFASDARNLEALNRYSSMKRAGATLVLREAGEDMQREIGAVLGDDKSDVANLVRDIGTKASTGDIGGFEDAVNKALDAAERMPDGKAKEEMKKKLAKIGVTNAAMGRRQGAKRSLDSFVKKGSGTLAEIAKATGLSEQNIQEALGLGSGVKSGDLISVNADVAEKLKNAAGAGAAGAVWGADGMSGAQKTLAKEQIVLMRTMTEALVTLAHDKNPKLLERFQEHQTKVAAADKEASPAPGRR